VADLLTPYDASRVAAVSYYKRYKMEADLAVPPPSPLLPPGFACHPWSDELLHDHAGVLFASFHSTIDAVVFPSLGDPGGCVALMSAVRLRHNFIPEATWLLTGPDGPCGSVQGLRERGVGAIQNLGVVPACRGLGLGESLLLLALQGFRRAGLARALLEVTARNDGALRLYRRVGFRCRKTLYKAVPDPRKDEG
jgi:GNAT superfamily N-acetyltransferase